MTRKIGRARPQTISQITGSSAHPFMHNDDIEVGTITVSINEDALTDEFAVKSPSFAFKSSLALTSIEKF